MKTLAEMTQSEFKQLMKSYFAPIKKDKSFLKWK